MSTSISRFEKVFSLQLDRVPLDAIGQTILQRIKELLAHRPDISRADFLRAVGRPTPSWGSEFFSGQRTTNDLRLLVKMARYFGVTVGHLLNETERGRDAGASTLLAAWESMTDERDRQAILNLALMLKGRGDDPGTAPDRGQTGGRAPGAGTTKAPTKRR